MTCASGAFQLMVVDPTMALPVTVIGFGFAVRDGPTDGQGALTDVIQTLPSNVLAPGSARFLISKPPIALWSTAICTGGLPTIVFPRKVLPWTPVVTKIPFALPTISLFSIVLSVSMAAGIPIPKLFP